MTSGTADTGIVIASTEAGTGTTGTGALTEEDIRRIVRDEVKEAFAKDPAARKAAIIASKGTLDWAYPIEPAFHWALGNSRAGGKPPVRA